jgi:hypothetical protein
MWRLGILFALVVRRLGLIHPASIHLLPGETQRFLRQADAVEVFSLAGETGGEGQFQGAKVLGSVVVENAGVRRRLMDRIILANRYSLGGLLCLGAEYGVRVRHGAAILDLTFCFDCSQVWVHGSDGYYDGGTVASFPVSFLNTILTKAGIPLPPPQEH